MGADRVSPTDLTTENYIDLGLWKEVPESELIPQGFNVTPSDSMGLGGLVVLNDLRSEVEAFINNADVDAGGDVSLEAFENAVIRALADTAVTSSGGDVFGKGKSLAVNATIATNRILSKANAYITNSEIATAASSGGDIALHAENTSDIESTVKTATQSGADAVGVTLAFNTIGYDAQNVLLNTFDALLATKIGPELPAEVQAYILNSDIQADGSIRLSADSKANLEAKIDTNATSAAAAFYGASGMAATGVLASNMVSSQARAFIEQNEFDLTTSAGSEALLPGARVKLETNTGNGLAGEIYEYRNESLADLLRILDPLRLQGPLELFGLLPVPVVDLSATDFSDTSLWKKLDYPVGAGNVAAGGDVSISATDDASIDAGTELVTTSTAINDVGVGVLNNLASTLLGEYQYTTESGVQDVVFGDKVRLADDFGTFDYTSHQGTEATLLVTGDRVKLDFDIGEAKAGEVYEYLGIDPIDLLLPGVLQGEAYGFEEWQKVGGRVFKYMGENDSFDLALRDYTDFGFWQEQDESNVIPSGIANAARTVLKREGGDSESFYALVVRNDVSSGAEAYLDDVDVVADGDVELTAVEAARITAVDNSIVKAGTAAKGGVIATNQLLSKADAFITDSTVTTTASMGGDLTLEAQNVSQVDATVLTEVVGGKAVSVVVAFNAIGWDSSNILFNAIDALLGTDLLIEAQPAETQAYFLNSDINVDGNLSLKADSREELFALDTSFGQGLDDAASNDDRADAREDRVFLEGLRTEFAGHGIELSDQLTVKILAVGEEWFMADREGSTYHVVRDGGVLNVSRTTVVNATVGNEAVSGKKNDRVLVDAFVAKSKADKAAAAEKASDKAADKSEGKKKLKFGANGMAAGGILASNRVNSFARAFIDFQSSDHVSSETVDHLRAGDRVELVSNVGGGTAGQIYEYVGPDQVVESSFNYSTRTQPNELVTGDRIKLHDDFGGGTGGEIYEYVGADRPVDFTAFAVDHTSADMPDELLRGALVRLTGDVGGGTNGQVYEYVGNDRLDPEAMLPPIDLSAEDYTSSDWRLVGIDLTAEDFAGSDWVLVNAPVFIDLGLENYAGSNWRLASSTPAGTVDVGGNLTIMAEDTATILADSSVEISAIVTNNLDAFAQLADNLLERDYDYTTKSGEQTLVSGDQVRVGRDFANPALRGVVFEYVGGLKSIDLNTLTIDDFEGEGAQTTSAEWGRLTGNISPSDLFPNLGNLAESNSRAVGGMVVLNDARSGVESYINNADVDAGGDIVLQALEAATILANAESNVTSSGGSAWGTGESLAINGQIVTNLVLSSADAYVTDSTLGDSLTPIGGNVSLEARNTSRLDATLNSSTSTGDTAVAVTLAFNTVGWKAQNILFNTVDALVGDPLISEAFDNEQPARVRAYIANTDVHVAGGLSLTAISEALINATLSNAAESAASALVNAGGKSIGFIIASNKVSSSAEAYIDNTEATGGEAIAVGGSVDIYASDDASNFANTKLVSASSTTNDGGAAVLQETLNDVLPADFLADDSVQVVNLRFGDRVRLDDGFSGAGGGSGEAGSVYEYLGTATTGAGVNLGAEAYDNLDFWKQVPATQLIPQGLNVTDSDSIGVGGLVVYNDVRTEVAAYIEDAEVTAADGHITITAIENATLIATTDSTATSSGGSVFGEGTSLAVNGVIATNLVLSSAKAFIKDSTVRAFDADALDGQDFGDIILDAQNTSILEATTLASTVSGDTAVGINLAFNTVGWKPSNVLFNTIDGLLGDPLISEAFDGEQSASVEAFIDNSIVEADGSVSLSALSTATIIATTSNVATSAASAFYGATGMSVGAVVTTNKVSSFAHAKIVNSDVDAATGVGVVADDNASITADNTLEAISSTTNDAGLSLVGDFAEKLINEYRYSSNSGEQEVFAGDKVRLASTYAGTSGAPEAIYRYVNDTDSAVLDLNDQDYVGSGDWELVDPLDIESIIPLGVNFNISESDSMAIGGLVVYSDVRSEVLALVQDSTVDVDGGNVEVTATENASIDATNVSVAEARGGSTFTGKGTSVAVNAVIATNVVLSAANAIILRSPVTTTGSGDVIVSAVNTSSINASTDSETTVGGPGRAIGVGVTLAFNTIGWQAQNFLFNTVDALIGTDIGTKDSAEVHAMVEDSDVTAAGAVSVTTVSDATISATVGTAATVVGVTLGDQTSVSVAAIIAANKISIDAEVSIEGGTLMRAGSGNIMLSASDVTSITALSDAPSLSIGAGAGSTTSVSVGVSVARNEIDNSLEAYAKDVALLKAVSGDVLVEATEAVTVDATSTSSAIAIAIGLGGSRSFTGAGAVAVNEILSAANAYITGSSVVAGGDVGLTASDTSDIDATVKAIAVAGGGGLSGFAPAVAIGISVSENRIGWVGPWDGDPETDDGTTKSPTSVRAHIGDSDVIASGQVMLSATGSATIDATIIAASASVTLAGGGAGLGLSGSGVYALNQIATNVEAIIGDGIGDLDMIRAGGPITLGALDESEITADAIGVAISITVSTGNAVAGSIGITIADNEISNETRAAIVGADVETTSGGVTLTATSTSMIDALAVAASASIGGSGSGALSLSGAAAVALNAIHSTTEALISTGSIVNAPGAVSMTATDDSSITADVVAASVSAGFGASTSGGLAVGITFVTNDVANITRAVVDGSTVTVGTDFSATALSTASIDALGIAASAQLTGSGSWALSGAGTGVDVDNIMANTTQAGIINGSAVTVPGAVTIAATDDATISANVVAASASVGIGSTGTLAVSIAVPLADNTIDNLTRALIDDSSVNAGGSLTLTADAMADIDVTGVAAALSVAASSGTLAVGASVTVAVVNNTVDGTIEALISDADAADAQSVTAGGPITISATNTNDIDALTGSVAASVAATGGSVSISAAAAVALAENTVGTDVSAGIINSVVNTTLGGVDIDALSNTTVDAVTFAASLGVSGSSSVAGSFTGAGARATNTITGATLATIEHSDVDAPGNITVDASDTSAITSDVVSASVSVGASSSVALSLGISVTLAENTISGSTSALILNSDVDSSAGLVNVSATGMNTIDSVAVAASASIAGSGSFSLAGAGSGASASNTTTNLVEASIVDSDVTTGDNVLVTASDTSSITADVVSVSASIGASGSAALSVAIAVTLAENSIGGTTLATIDNSTVDAKGLVMVSATANNTIDALAAAIGVSVSGSGTFSLSGAGSGASASNTTTNLVEASIVDSDVTTGDNVLVTASDTSSITADIASVSASVAASGTAAVSVSVAVTLAENAIGGTTLATIDNSTVNTDGLVTVSAMADSTIDALALALGVSVSGSGSFSLSGAGSGASAVNTTTNLVEASIANGSDVDAGGNVAVTASDTSTINAEIISAAASIAGSGAAAISVSIAVTLAENSIGGTTLASIDGSTIDTPGSVMVTALADTDIDAVAAAVSVGVAGSGAFSLSGAGSGAKATNITTNAVEASIRGGSAVTAVGNITVDASDTSSITSTLVSAAISVAGSGTAAISVSVAVTLAENFIGGTTFATIDGSTVNSTGGAVSVSALGDQTIDSVSVSAAISISGSGAVSLGGAGTGAVATNTTTNSVEASIAGGSDVDALGNITIEASNLSNITAELFSAAVSVTASGTVSAGVAIAITMANNSIGGTTLATIENSDVDTSGAVDVTALANTTIDALGVAAALAVGGSGGVSVTGAGTGVIARNTMTNTIEASITNGSDVDAGGSVTLSATDTSAIDATLAAASIAASGSGDAAINFALAISIADNQFGTVVRSAIDGSDVTSTGGSVFLTALSDGSVKALSTGAGIALGGSGAFSLSATAAGAIANTTMTNLTEAVISGDSTVTANGGAVTLSATDDTLVDVDVVAVGVSGGGAVGVTVNIALEEAVATTDVMSTVRAEIEDSKVDASGNVLLTAAATTDVDTLGVGTSISVGGAGSVAVSGAGAAAVVGNTVATTVEALITDSDTADGQAVTAGGGITLNATDDLTVNADAWAASAAISASYGVTVSVSIAAAVATNLDNGVTRAGIRNSRVDANGGAVLVSAESLTTLSATPDAYAIAAAIGIGLAASGSGASATNTVTRTIEGVVSDGSNVTASTLVQIGAHDNSDATAEVDSVALAAGLTGAAVSVGLATNTLTSTTTARISDSSVEAEGGSITIDADATQDVNADASVVAVTAAIGVAGAGGDATTDLDSIVEAFARNATLTTSEDLYIDADSMHTARAKTFGLGAALGFSVSVMVSEASVGGATRAFADGATTIDVDSQAQITADSTALALPDADSVSISLAGGAGAVVDADVDRTTEAYVGTRAGTTPGAQTTLSISTDDLYIKANSNYEANASPLGLSFGLLASGAVTISDADITGATLAYVGEKTNVTAGELDVIASSIEDADANNVLVSIGGYFSASISESTATIDSDTEAFTGVRAGESPPPGATTTITLTDGGNGDGTAVIDTDATRTTTSSASGGSASYGVTVNVFLPTADTSGSVRAYAGEGTVLTADDLTITADADTMTADADILAGSIAGFAAVDVLQSLAKVTGEVEAFIGAQAADVSSATASPVIDISGTELVDGDVIVDADATMTATAEAFGTSVSFVLDVDVVLPQAQVSGATRAYIRDGADLTSDTLKVEAGDADVDRVRYLANSTSFMADFSLIASIDVIDAEATIDGVVEAFIGAPAGLGKKAFRPVLRQRLHRRARGARRGR
jgi:hypothetical protein